LGSRRSLNLARQGLAAAGIQTAAIAFGGESPGGNTGNTEEYNGSTWTTVSPMATVKYFTAGAGTQPAALAFGGQDTVIQLQQKNTMLWRTKHIPEHRTSLVQWYYEGIKIYR
jgi:hypothetical protein